ncbi:tail fiber domain-containing protein [Tritonibacter scottomollicae]|uniref:Endosialidase-like protein n=1 Tax=Tritonibacter scottomollicae TaxID=483013 RepID=A0A2T1AHL2_TRISK|nr:tail fiber domain-containing protein [Tritonibacter scottomollicae]PRZ48046.1 endosialidase-like protein [Tritonibacter scottomollicae]
MSIPGFSPFPPIPKRSTPEADFDAKMYALFQHFAVTHRNELLAFIEFLETNVTAIEGAINGVSVGLTHPEAAKFTDLEVLGAPGVLARFRDGVASNFLVQTAGNKTTIGNAAGSSRLALMAGNQEAIEFDSAGRASGAAVQANAADITDGRLMKNGAHGLGSGTLQVNENDWNEANASGLFHTDSNGLNKPGFGSNFAGVSLRRNDTLHAEIAVALNAGADQNARTAVRAKTGANTWSPWREFMTLDANGRTAQGIEVRNSSPFFAITDSDTGAKHVLSGNSTAGHLYIKTDPNEIMPGSALLIETQAKRQMVISKDDVEFEVPIKGTTNFLGNVISGYRSAASAAVEVGSGRTADGPAYLDLVGDTEYIDYGLRLIRNSGENGSSVLSTRGSGGFTISCSDGANVTLRSHPTRAVVLDTAGNFRPATDNVSSSGSSSYRWSQVYAGTGTINTSDARSKQDIQDLDAAERRVAVAAKGLLKKYRMRDAVAEKGDGARWHFGVIAQELAAAFEAEGLDPWRYGVLCWDEWWSAEVEIPAETTPIMEEVEEEVIHMVTVDEPVLDEHGEPTGEVQQVEKEVIELVKKQVETGELEILMEARTELQVFTSAEDAPEGAEYHNRQGVRYDELFAFILAAI